LYFKYSKESEAVITKIRVQLENTDTLSQFATKLNFQQYILIAETYEKGKSRFSKKILENTFEAFLCSLYLDQGMETTKEFIINLVGSVDTDKYLKQDSDLYDTKDFLYKLYDKFKLGYPSFKIIDKFYSNNKPYMKVGLFLEKNKIDLFCESFKVSPVVIKQNTELVKEEYPNSFDSGQYVVVEISHGMVKKEVEKKISKYIVGKQVSLK
jgi:dsRNA-specific ribonuclease